MIKHTNTNGQQEVALYLIHNKPFIKQQVEFLINQKDKLLLEQDISFHDDILKQHYDLVKTYIMIDIGRNLAVAVEDIIQVIEDINLEEYLK